MPGRTDEDADGASTLFIKKKPRVYIKKHRSKVFYIFISSFIVSLSLLLTLVFPVFSGKSGIEIIQEMVSDSGENIIRPLGGDPYSYYNESALTMDCYLGYSDNDYGTAHDASTAESLYNATTFFAVGQFHTDMAGNNIYRTCLVFDTSSIAGPVDSATLYLNCFFDLVGVGGREFDVTVTFNDTDTYFSIPPTESDYNYSYYNDTDGGTWNTTGYSDENYISITLTDPLGESYVNQSGYTKIYLQSSYDIADSMPNANTNEYIYFHSSTSVGKEPYLNVTYTPDTSPPEVVINFAGNLSDWGGPYWQPPDESQNLSDHDTIEWQNGYYTDGSKQHEDWIYINLTATDTTGVNNIWLNWLNGTTWTNWTYAFVNTAGNYWEYNTSGIKTCEGYDYSFNIVANDTLTISNNTWWNKTGIGGSYTRRYVQLNCTQENISYTCNYLYNLTYGAGDVLSPDRSIYDIGVDGTIYDSGIINTTVPNETVSIMWCTTFWGVMYGESKCIEPMTLGRLYVHTWTNNTAGAWPIDYRYGRSRSFADITQQKNNSMQFKKDIITNMTYDGRTYSLLTHMFNDSSDPLNFTDNSIYEFWFMGRQTAYYPGVFSNRSMLSFVILDLPSNNTLLGLDTDSDGINDWYELFNLSTSPFLADTDNDMVSDFDENLSGSDPNNYTDAISLKVWQEIINTINGSYTNTTYWVGFSSDINGSYINTTDWVIFSSDINGSYINTTEWTTFSTSINGSYLNTTLWSAFSTSINGTYSNVTDWISVSNTINGSYTNTTYWVDVSTTINGSYTNTTSWSAFSTTINGSYTSVTSFTTFSSDINGSYINTSYWVDVSTNINGSYTNATSWSAFNTSINGSYTSVTEWTGFSTSINGTYKNTTDYTPFSTDINGSYINTTYWVVISTTINGSYINTTSFKPFSTSINGSYINTTLWSVFSTSINGSYINTSVKIWLPIISTINGTYINTTLWSVFSTSINGSYVNTTSFKTFSTTINGSYVNTSTFWYVIISTINGSYTNSSLNIIISNVNPVNESSTQSDQPILYFTLTNPTGDPMNYSIFVGNSTSNTTYLLTNVSGASDGTYFYSNYTNATSYGTYYYWRVYANDSVSFVNKTFYFLLSFGYTGYIVGGGNAGAIAFASASLLTFLMGLLIVRRRRKKQ